MTNQESTRFSEYLLQQQFNEHDKKVILTILEGNGNYNQEDILEISEHNLTLLKKLGWLRKVKKAAKEAGLRVRFSD